MMGNGDAHVGLDAVRDWSDLLSLGEQQRLAFARLLYNRPTLAILDESTSALVRDIGGLFFLWWSLFRCLRHPRRFPAVHICVICVRTYLSVRVFSQDNAAKSSCVFFQKYLQRGNGVKPNG